MTRLILILDAIKSGIFFSVFYPLIIRTVMRRKKRTVIFNNFLIRHNLINKNISDKTIWELFKEEEEKGIGHAKTK